MQEDRRNLSRALGDFWVAPPKYRGTEAVSAEIPLKAVQILRFDDGKVDQQCADAPHHHHLPRQISKIGKELGECVYKIHVDSVPP